MDNANEYQQVLKCPGCMAQLEVPSDVPEGIHIRCECCQTKFAFGTKGEIEILEVPKRPLLPIKLKISLISMAVLSSFGFMGKAKDCFVASLLVYLILLGLIYGMWKGRRICRIIFTGITVATWLFAAENDTTAAMIIFGLWAIPLTFLWLPDSSDWFKKMRWWIRGMRAVDTKFKESSENVRIVWGVVGGALLYVAALLACSMNTDLSQVAISDLHWFKALAGVSIVPFFIWLLDTVPKNYMYIPIVLAMVIGGGYIFFTVQENDKNDLYY